ncbi:Os10g0558532 [Oryza sativa Japonica Group]|uniref:Os10g0558532 protein n=1 Tax=Oryza sativa subsp. japonica TaxID=39947 RepID=A0A0P0XXK6_ORYSJ|nr:Os10g0558532 [Oryza sativa Japonica Group]
MGSSSVRPERPNRTQTKKLLGRAVQHPRWHAQHRALLHCDVVGRRAGEWTTRAGLRRRRTTTTRGICRARADGREERKRKKSKRENAERRSSALAPQPRPWMKSFLLTGSASAARCTVVIVAGVVFAASRLSPLPPARWPPHPPTRTAAFEDAEVGIDVVRSHGHGGAASAAGLVPFSPLVSLPPAAASRPFSPPATALSPPPVNWREEREEREER